MIAWGDQPDPACWADGCMDRKTTPPLGLCAKHRKEIAG